MKIQYASDLHLEYPENREWLREHPLQVTGEILVLAGDTVYLDHIDDAAEFFRWCSINYKETFLIPGNHEFYSGRYNLAKTLKSFEIQILPNVRYINNKSVRLGDTELFFSTLWTHIESQKFSSVESSMNDYKRISFEDRQFRAQDSNLANAKCLSWLAMALDKSDSPKKIVVTHHCPLDSDQAMKKVGADAYPGYCEPLPFFIEKNHPAAWIHGHIHDNIPERISSGTKVVTNVLGLAVDNEQKDFDNGAFIDTDNII